MTIRMLSMAAIIAAVLAPTAQAFACGGPEGVQSEVSGNSAKAQMVSRLLADAGGGGGDGGAGSNRFAEEGGGNGGAGSQGVA